ncbi:MAG: hypothetical protein PHR35_16195, partial [Kiritimatiellae bacterium]|nr:hypothetical protein [Kiritimatiellia bacterium]
MRKQLAYLLVMSLNFIVTPGFPEASAQTTTAGLRLPAVFGDHMVLQADQPIPVWGWAHPGAAVTVEFHGQSRKATTGQDGKWQVTLKPVPTDHRPATLRVAATSQSDHQTPNTECLFSDVLVGDVWLCAGQSNMGFPMSAAEGGKEAAS